MKKAIAVIGDIHGCLEEFDELLKLIQYDSSNIRLVLLGDLVDRGPSSSGVVARSRELNLECVKGNHEDKALRWHKHELNRLTTGKPNPMKSMNSYDASSLEKMKEEDWQYLESLPIRIQLEDYWWAMHAGVEPGVSWERQNPAQVMRVRYVNQYGKGVSLNSDLSQPENTKYWTEKWQGPYSIVYGHCVHSLDTPREDKHMFTLPSIVVPNSNFIGGFANINFPSIEYKCLGIDTGCVFGGNLTCAIIDGMNIEYAQVKAKHKYANSGKD